MNPNFAGIFPPIPTPFENGRFSPSRLEQNLTRWHETGLSGYLVLGSNGEAALLTESEKLEVVRVARRHIPADKLMIVGTGLESTAATCVLTQRVADLGAEAVLVLSPFFYRQEMTNAALRRHYETVAEASPVPVLIYNVPKFTNLNLSPDLIAELSRHPKLAGMKDSAGNLAQLLELREKTPDEFQILIGSDAVFFAGMLHQLPGAILAIANLVPRECVALRQAVLARDCGTAEALAVRLAPVGRIVIGRHGLAGLKAALDELGYYGGEPRPPLLPLDATGRLQVRQALQQAGVL